MNFIEFNLIVKEIKGKHPIWFALEADPTSSEEEIVSVEKEMNVILPAEYKEFVINYGGGYFAFSNVYSTNKSSDWNIIERNKPIAMKNFIAISDNGVGDYYGFKISNGICRAEICILDHEVGLIRDTIFSTLFAYLKEVALTPR